jgi:hypothetical protein
MINLFDRGSSRTPPDFHVGKTYAPMDRRNAAFKGWQVYALPASGFRFQRPHDDRELAVSALTLTQSNLDSLQSI